MERDLQDRQQPETLRLRSVVPAITASDLEKSIAWYRDVLGFTVGAEHQVDGVLKAVEMKAGSVDFLVSQDDFAQGRDRVKGVGLRLYCETAQDVDLVATDIVARGGELAQPLTDQPWGARDFAVVDPDGFKISISNSD